MGTRSTSKKPSDAAAPHLSATPRIDPRYCCFRLELRPSAIHRWGVFAGETIPANRKVIEYTGEKINRRETKRRGLNVDLTYLFTLNDYWTLDGSVGGSGAEFINHSCAPNVRAMNVQGRHILYMSKRIIRKGEELTVDYRFAHDVEKTICKCGAAECRGTINLRRGE